MNLLILGATGRTGQLLVDQALTAGHKVTAYVRSPQKMQPRENLKIISGTIADAQALNDAMAEQEAVILTLGATDMNDKIMEPVTKNLIAAMHTHKVKRVVMMSTFLVHDSFVAPKEMGVMLQNMAGILADKRSAEQLLAKSDLDWTTVHPGMLTDGPVTGKYQITFSVANPPNIQISRADVADFLLKAVQSDKYHQKSVVINY